MVIVKDLVFAYGQTTIFKGLSWSVRPGEVWALVGPSGCGKTTLLYLLAGLQRPQSGSVLVGGTPVIKPRTSTGLILQDHGLLPWATVWDNTALGFKIRKVPAEQYAPVIEEWLTRLGLFTLRGRYPAQLSGGQRQRVAIARTLSLEPDLLLMDEPFSALDALTREDLQDLLAELNRERPRTTVLVTHNIEEAVYLARRIGVLGLPPNSDMPVIENPNAGTPGYRSTPEFSEITDRLRRAVDAAGRGELHSLTSLSV